MTASVALWQKWTDLWYNELHLADEIIADGFRICLQSEFDLSAINDAKSVRQWVIDVNTIFRDAKFTAELGPIITDEYIVTHWSVIGKLGPNKTIGPEGATFTRVLTEILKVDGDGKISECWASCEPVKVVTD